MNIKDYGLLKEIADMDSLPSTGAFNIRLDGEGAARRSTENIEIISKTDKAGIDIRIKPDTVGEMVHIPVVITKSGLNDKVYNDFFIGESSDVTIIAGCGIHNEGSEIAQHDGIHRFFIGRNARVKYIEKHYGEGEGTGENILNPTTEVFMEENSYCEMEMVQIAGVDSTKRVSTADLEAGAKILMIEKLLTHGRQTANSDMEIRLNGEDSSAQIISRSVAKDSSQQVFYPRAVGNNQCKAHIQCDSIIMDSSSVRAIPEVAANHSRAEIIHEAAIGRINNDQLLKLMSMGMDAEQAEKVILEGFLK